MAQGFVAAGTLRPGDALTVQPGSARTRVARIAAPAGNRAQAATGDHVALVLDPPVDAPRGALLAADPPPDSADQFEAELLWAGDAPLVPGRAYGFQLHAAQATARIAPPRARICPDTGARLAADTLRTNDLGVVRVALDRRVAFSPFPENRTLGAFILTHPETRETVAAGTIRFALRRTQTIAWAEQSVTPAMRASLLAQRPRVAWLTGLSGSGKSTVADLADRRLHALGRPSIILDGDNLRHGLNRDLGFTEADRIENLRRAAEVARLLADSGLFVLAAFISPFAAERAAARALIGPRFLEIHLDVPLAVAESRDPKGLYARARAGQIANFTGISSPYEPPEAPELRLDPSMPAEAAAELVVRRLLED
jgi:bifunctional enzyme CysN/CysC